MMKLKHERKNHMGTKRVLSVLLTLSMIISLFAGMTTGITVPVEAAEDAPSTAKIGSYTIAVPKGVVQGDVSAEPIVVTTPEPSDIEVTWGSSGVTTWYVVAEDVTIKGQYVDINGHVNLILPKGKELNVKSERSYAFDRSPDCSLTIWETTDGGGTLFVDKEMNCNGFTINGGTVKAETSKGYCIVPHGGLTINGGTLIANQTKSATNPDDDWDEYNWAYAIDDTDLVINGGELIASVSANSPYTAIEDGRKTLAIDPGAIVELGDPSDLGFFSQKYIHITVPTPKKVSSYEIKEITDLAELTADDKAEDITVLADKPFYYEEDLKDGVWYVVDDDITIKGNMYVKGNVNLVLADGKTLTVEGQLKAHNGGSDFGSLTIWGQKNGTGTLTVNGVSGHGQEISVQLHELIINGGTLNAKGALHNYVDGTVTVNGGTVNAESSDGGAIHIFYGELTINGGKVNAKGPMGIWAMNSTVYFNGGVVTAEGWTSGLYSGVAEDFVIRGGKVISKGLGDYDAFWTGVSIDPYSGATAEVRTAYNADGTGATVNSVEKGNYYPAKGTKYVQIRVAFPGHVMAGRNGFDAKDNHFPAGTTGMWDEITEAGGELASGNYYLDDDVTLTGANLTIPEDATVNLCLNGYTLTGKSGSSIITVGTGATLNLYDCGTKSKKCAVGFDGKWTLDEDGENSIISGSIVGGAITGGTDGGVTVNGSLNLHGGNIVGNDGGGVMVKDGAKITVGGTAVVKGNTKDGKACNVTLAKDTYISFGNHEENHEEPVEGCNGVLAPVTIISDKNKNKMEIYVTTTTDTNVYNSEGDIIAETATDYTNCIKSDNATRKVVFDSGKLKLFKGHVHKWDYTADGAKLYAYCTETEDASACGYQGTENAVVLTLTVSTSNYSGGSEIVSAGSDEEQFFWKMALGEASIPAVHYVGRAGTTTELADTTTEPTT